MQLANVPALTADLSRIPVIDDYKKLDISFYSNNRMLLRVFSQSRYDKRLYHYIFNGGYLSCDKTGVICVLEKLRIFLGY